MDKENTFTTVPGFCSDCGSILPQLQEKGNINCYSCGREFAPEGKGLTFEILKFQSHRVKYSICSTW